MQRTAVLTLVMLAALAPGAVTAQADSPGLSLSLDATAAPLTYAQLLADMAQPDVAPALAAIGAVTADTEVRFATASSLAGSPDANDSALARINAGSARLDALRAAVTANAALMAKLGAAGYEAADVLAVQPDAEGALVVYVEG